MESYPRIVTARVLIVGSLALLYYLQPLLGITGLSTLCAIGLIRQRRRTLAKT